MRRRYEPKYQEMLGKYNIKLNDEQGV
jgi:hypothetical protein